MVLAPQYIVTVFFVCFFFVLTQYKKINVKYQIEMTYYGASWQFFQIQSGKIVSHPLFDKPINTDNPPPPSPSLNNGWTCKALSNATKTQLKDVRNHSTPH